MDFLNPSDWLKCYFEEARLLKLVLERGGILDLSALMLN